MIRPWETADTKAVAEIEARSFSDPWNEKMLAETLRMPAFKGFVYEENGEVIGYIGLILPDDAEIALIAVREDHRRRGIGEKLLERAAEEAKEGGAKNVFLAVRTGNSAARALYEKNGFVPVYVRNRYYSDGEDALVMVRSLL